MNLISLLLLGCCAISMLATYFPRLFNVTALSTQYITDDDWLSSASGELMSVYNNQLLVSQLSSEQLVNTDTKQVTVVWTSTSAEEMCVAVNIYDLTLSLVVVSASETSVLFYTQ